MDKEQVLAEARSLKFWIGQNKTKCIIFAAVVVIADRIFHAFFF